MSNNLCLGNDIAKTEKIWNTINCPSFFQGIMYCSEELNNNDFFRCPTNSTYNYNPDNAQIARQYMTEILEQYFNINDITNNTLFLQKLIDTCNSESLPGLCQDFLPEFCKGKISVSSNINTNVLYLCGCYSDLSNNKCFTLCSRSGTSKPANLDNGKIERCTEPVCIIDNFSITLLNSVIKEGVNFNSVCGNCADNSNKCNCIISSENIPQTLNDMSIGDNINTYCSEQSKCIENGNVYSCSEYVGYSINNNTSGVSYFGIIILIIMIIIALIIIISYLYFKRNKSTST